MNIVEKLRLMQTDHFPELGEAIAEIEHLRREVHAWSKACGAKHDSHLANGVVEMTKLSDLQEALSPACDQDGHPVTQQRYDDLLAENKRLRGHIEQLREAVEEGLSTYKVPMTARICEAIAALAATEPPIGDSGILDGSNRTTGGWIGQP